jgi:poly-gamma-glutamate capsule biosynthesis protein CapA/YwtB (metallophosphatase superfamily)
VDTSLFACAGRVVFGMKFCYHTTSDRLIHNCMNIFLRVFVLCLFPGFLWSQNGSESSAIIVFTGDLNFAHRFEQSAKTHPLNVFARWKNIGTYDCMMVNLENAVTESSDSVEKEFVFKMKTNYLSLLHDAGISIVNCANNHTADFGTEGILETICRLDSFGIQHTGIGRNLAEARKPVVLDINGVRIGILGYGGVSAFIASRTRPGTVPRSLGLIREDIQKLKPQVDYVVVQLHWGTELETIPDSSQIAFAHRIIESGADLIVGHHPHVLQGIEYYRKKVVAYSLGNFIFGGNSKSANCETAVLKVRFTKDTMDVQPFPISIHHWQPEPADSAASDRVMTRILERSKIFLETIPLTSYRSAL